MLLQMGFQDDRWWTRYEKLTSIDNEKAARPRRRWVTKMNGKLRGLRLSRSRRVNWKAFSIVILPRKITDMYADIVSRMKTDDICPTIVFSGPWGLPFLSHSNAKCKSGISLHRNLACFQ